LFLSEGPPNLSSAFFLNHVVLDRLMRFLYIVLIYPLFGITYPSIGFMCQLILPLKIPFLIQSFLFCPHGFTYVKFLIHYVEFAFGTLRRGKLFGVVC